MQAGNVYRIRTVAATHFIGAANQNVPLSEDLDLFASPPTVIGDRMGVGAGKHVRVRLRELRIVSVQNLAWEVWFFGTLAKGTAVIGDEKYLGRQVFAAGDGVQATGDSFFYYYVQNLDLTYQDLLNTGQIHLRLINRSAAAKIAGANGGVELEFAFELLQGR